jgi:hypothetical protein
MLAYVTLGSNQLEASSGFYDQILGLLGAGRIMELPERGVIWGTDAPMVALMRPKETNWLSAALPENHQLE